MLIAFHFPRMRHASAEETQPQGNAEDLSSERIFQVTPDNKVMVVINKLEMGQGVNTSMAQLIAEELDCDFNSVPPSRRRSTRSTTIR